MKILTDSGLTYLWDKIESAIATAVADAPGGTTYTAGAGISIVNGVISLDVVNGEEVQY